MCTVTVDRIFCHSLDLLGLRASGLQVSRSRPHVPGFNSAARGGRVNVLNVSTTTHCYHWNWLPTNGTLLCELLSRMMVSKTKVAGIEAWMDASVVCRTVQRAERPGAASSFSRKGGLGSPYQQKGSHKGDLSGSDLFCSSLAATIEVNHDDRRVGAR